jgi:hypothetical protein
VRWIGTSVLGHQHAVIPRRLRFPEAAERIGEVSAPTRIGE